MNDARTLVETLKKLLKARSITYAQLASRAGLSEASVKRLFSRGTFTLARLAQFCELLEIDVYELARLGRGRDTPTRELSDAQEAALAGDPRLLALFYLVLNGWTRDDLVARYQIGAHQCTALLLKLDRLGLIELMPADRIRLKVPRGVRLRPNGAIRRRHGKRAIEDFLEPQFAALGGYFAFEFRDLSRASVEILRRKLERLAAEFHELAELDSPLSATQRETVGLALGIRPWSMESAIELAPRRRLPSG